jgi:6-pyruvoyltetrahydropterin/6-carboxytetrahydropterin synthase
MGWTVDFGDVKTLFEPVFKALDHRNLSDVAGIEDGDTASIAAWIYREAKRDLPCLTRVDLYETEGCGTIVAESLEGPTLPV